MSAIHAAVASLPREADQTSTTKAAGRGLFGTAVAVAFWSAGLGLTVSELAVPFLIPLFLAPLAGFWYLVVCVIAWSGASRA